MGVFAVIIFAITNNYKNFVITGFIFGVIVMILMFILVPESPRYYVAIGKTNKALSVYKYLA